MRTNRDVLPSISISAVIYMSGLIIWYTYIYIYIY